MSKRMTRIKMFYHVYTVPISRVWKHVWIRTNDKRLKDENKNDDLTSSAFGNT